MTVLQYLGLVAGSILAVAFTMCLAGAVVEFDRVKRQRRTRGREIARNRRRPF